ncbi:hypothetical protein TIFTF001_024820 [Ficus carica]|uniref:Ubiquitin-like protease family profile domain-containing protein n=1 Tax=Ficus carica TaxID=3494 RepID=A0AA88DGA1_FICCA|nr:hypothetical protein TIFTF001_024820 [Ficus carica]
MAETSTFGDGEIVPPTGAFECCFSLSEEDEDMLSHDEFLSCLPADIVSDTYIGDLWLYHKKDWSFKDADILLIRMFICEAKHWVLGYVESVRFFYERPSNYFDSQLKLLAPMETMFPTTPQQRNGTDCGMHVIISALCPMRDLGFKCMEEIAMDLIREEISIELYNHHLQKDRLFYESDDDRGVRMPRVNFVFRGGSPELGLPVFRGVSLDLERESSVVVCRGRGRSVV